MYVCVCVIERESACTHAQAMLPLFPSLPLRLMELVTMDPRAHTLHAHGGSTVLCFCVGFASESADWVQVEALPLTSGMTFVSVLKR